LRYAGPAQRPVTFFERAGDRLEPLGQVTTHAYGVAYLPDATTWRCDRLVRRFEASAVDASGHERRGTYEVRTPSCATRLHVSTPAHVALGRVVTVRIADRWQLGDADVRLCTAGAGRPRACHTLHLAAHEAVSRTLRPYRSGRLRVSVMLGGHAERRIVAAGSARPEPAPPLPVVLAVGDSTIQGINSVLEDRLRHEVDFGTVSRPGSGLSVPGKPTWMYLARRHVAQAHPRLTVFSVGTNEGWDMRTPKDTRVDCCGKAWTAEFARRARTVMRTYARGGAAHVVWLTLLIPEDPRRQYVARAVNAAYTVAAHGLPTVHLFDLNAIFPAPVPPDIREPDGIHLTVKGILAATRELLAQVRSGGWLD
jgi:lysophospholipase L1-like esterase